VRQLVASLRVLGHEVVSNVVPGTPLRLLSLASSPFDWDFRSIELYRRLIVRNRPDAVLGFYDYDMSLCEAAVREAVPFVSCVQIHWPACPIGVLYIDGEGVCSGPSLKKCIRHMSSRVPDARLPMVGSSLPPPMGAAVYSKFASRHRSLSKSNAIIVPSQSAKVTMVRAGYSRIHVVPNAVDTSEFPSSPVSLAPPHRFLLPSASPSERKGFAHFEEAAKRIRVRESGAHFVATNFAGNSLIEGLPYLTRSEMIKEYARSYAVIVPILWDEPFGLVILEAMAAGRPVVAYNAGAASEIVDDGRTGILVPRGDVAALSGAIQCLTERPDLATSMGNLARSRVESDFTTQKMAAGYLSVLKSTLEDSLPMRDT
jgi:glycosyltransferase involved in cell wall biosynthesis